MHLALIIFSPNYPLYIYLKMYKSVYIKKMQVPGRRLQMMIRALESDTWVQILALQPTLSVT